ncbi:MAG: hypothetical protein GX317_08515, partial [Staphylococcus equorum]|nr:hypothetical protein [Staphylococcus equorum]
KTFDNETINEDIPNKIKENKLKEAFSEFAMQHKLLKDNYTLDDRCPSFILEEFRRFDKKLGLPRWKWWLNNAVIMWFERLKDDRLKFVIEIGPLEPHTRIKFLERLEKKGIKIKKKSKSLDACYTRIFTPTKPVLNWNDKDEILNAMNEIYDSEGCRKVVGSLIEVSREI